jgi:hypothetical protein
MEGLSIWKPVEISAGQCVSWDCGELSVWVERYEHEWHVLTEYKKSAESETAAPIAAFREKVEKPVSQNWKHFLLKEGGWAIPVPAMLDRPVVIRPDRTLVLLPGEAAQFFVALPVWFRLLVGKAVPAKLVSASGGGPRTLFEQPITAMSNAWFGDPVSGELCYYLEARLYPEHPPIPRTPFLAICPLRIRNESEGNLPFERICLHTEFLGVYHSAERLWTHAVDVVFRGPDQATLLQPSKSPPTFDGKLTPLSGPRQAMENSYFRKTFNILKSFTGF